MAEPAPVPGNVSAEALKKAAELRREEERATGWPEFMDVEDYLAPEDREKIKEQASG